MLCKALNDLIVVPTMCRFAEIDMIKDQIPGKNTILAFQHILEKRDLGIQVFEVVTAHLKAYGMGLSKGRIIDASLITTPSFSKNEKRERDQEVHQTCKGKQCSHSHAEGLAYGMHSRPANQQAHMGVERKKSGLAHSVETTVANVHASNLTSNRLRCGNTVFYEDGGYQGIEKRD
jgi:IS5 family transposase